MSLFLCYNFYGDSMNVEDSLLKNFNLIINEISDKIFGCETEFQIELILLFRKLFPNCIVRAEYPYKKKKIDILIITQDGKWVPIELKYKKKGCKILNNGLEIKLENDGAQTDNVYYFLKDIERIEHIKQNNADKFLKGYVIFLTNDSSYWKNVYKPVPDINEKYSYSLLGKEIFIPDTSIYRNKKLKIVERHLIKWHNFNNVMEENIIEGNNEKCSIFRYLIAEIQ